MLRTQAFSDVLKGYGKLATLYASYLKTKLCLSGLDAFRNRQNFANWDSFNRSTITLREALLSSIEGHSVNGARCLALRLVLQDCLQMDGKLAIDGERISEELAMSMGALEVDSEIHDKVERRKN